MDQNIFFSLVLINALPNNLSHLAAMPLYCLTYLFLQPVEKGQRRHLEVEELTFSTSHISLAKMMNQQFLGLHKCEEAY